MLYIVMFLGGAVVGGCLAIRISRKKKVGALILDFSNPLNDQPFLLELNTNVNRVYRKKYIVLRVKSDCHPTHK